MCSFFLSLLTFILVCVSVFVILIILMQRPSANAGMGAALGGGAAESAFGSETTKILTKWTVSGMVIFFALSFVLSMMHISCHYGKRTYADGIKLESLIDGDESQRE
ncbi:MAG: preprotein translocase subunit SecG [Puniceicoccales bacterium]|jgi:preprotein translocase subunit SecG|nr:preprotein translocase subunit SecG [Puniceicoccales bacterium]